MPWGRPLAIYTMPRGVFTSTVRKNGPSLYVLLPASLAARLMWRHQDVVVLREAGEKLIIERIQTEKLAILRTGDAEVAP
jgi:antitoxin component of MazEF toxin-antitoxin module